MSNAQRRCPECNAPLSEDRKNFCSTKCATRARVRRFRLKHNDEGTAHVKIRLQQEAENVERAQVAARKKLRQAAKERRDELKRLNQELTRELEKDIAVGNARIAQSFETAMNLDFDNGRLALAIAATDAMTN